LDNDLPVDFFTRLIWQESHFDPQARSYAGAQGIAQFMPATAQGRGLANPFDPYVALRESARFLRELRGQFGNLGLAAAAYNGGPGRVQAWLGGHGRLPAQTRAYVRIITGRAAEKWVGVGDKPADRMGTTIPCDEIARLLVRVAESTHERANQSCSRSEAVGGKCIVRKN
jgi:soluble lytic murein transglycosylase-like protein